MNDESWIKLYRKTLLNGILRDHEAWALFTWMLLTCNRKGEVIVSRFNTADALNMSPSQFYRCLKRLSQKWHAIALKSNNRFTVVKIVNWAKYQLENTEVNNKRTTSEQQANTYTRIENKNRDVYTSIEYLKNIPLEDFVSLSEGLSVSEIQVKDKAAELLNYCLAKGKVYKNYKAFLRNALVRDFPRNRAKAL